jgi:hypothetical protein
VGIPLLPPQVTRASCDRLQVWSTLATLCYEDNAMASLATERRAIAEGRYQLQRLLGEGSRKRVYLAHDTRLDREVAKRAFLTLHSFSATLAMGCMVLFLHQPRRAALLVRTPVEMYVTLFGASAILEAVVTRGTSWLF